MESFGVAALYTNVSNDVATQAAHELLIENVESIGVLGKIVYGSYPNVLKTMKRSTLISPCAIQRDYRFSATKGHLSLCAGCNVKMRSVYVPDPPFPPNTHRLAHLTPVILTPTPSLAPVDCAELTQSESANSEQNGDVNRETPPMDEDVDENDLVVCGAVLLNKLLTNLSSSVEKAELFFGDPDNFHKRERS
ncbi:hypothetical protein KIN20_007395 [Parelaphostrongylus tenuis]|uniref:Uncharacterized protein n=1 Tax=Parelaphostrongylus tenuis TaxID=148309 RepID=A0AAD5QK08_PARTN|nr:hypothetical protein KIN20_007395 [Parelaphostrongylus tenuis]